MKIISIILSVALIFSSNLIELLLNITLSEARFEAKENLSRELATNHLKIIKIPSTSHDVISGDELWFNDKLYDVAKTELINDSVYYYVLEDQQEQETLENIYEHFNTEFQVTKSLDPKLNLHKASVRFSNIYCFNLCRQKYYQDIFLSKNQFRQDNYVTYSCKVLTPPPESFLLS